MSRSSTEDFVASWTSGDSAERQESARRMYDDRAKQWDPVSSPTFMNFGYLVRGEQHRVPGIERISEISAHDARHYDLLCAQYYDFAARHGGLRGRCLEVGSGRGGGAAYIARTFGLDVTGVDISDHQVAFCNQRFQSANLRFLQGSAMELPCASNAFDSVLNVESSHCYPDRGAFFREVARVLAPGGTFVFCDVYGAAEVPGIHALLSASGLRVDSSHEMRDGVLRSLELRTHMMRVSLLRGHAPVVPTTRMERWRATAARLALPLPYRWRAAARILYGDAAWEESCLAGSKTFEGLKRGELTNPCVVCTRE